MNTPPPLHENQQQRNVVKDDIEATKDNITVLWKYVVNRILRYVDALEWRKYVVKCYGYGPGNDLLDLPHHLHTQCIMQYWNSLKPNANAQGTAM